MKEIFLKIKINIKKKYFILFVIVFALTILNTGNIYAWDNCPYGLENDYYPGDCHRYIDTDKDGICDRSQPTPEDRETKTILPYAQEVKPGEESFSIENNTPEIGGGERNSPFTIMAEAAGNPVSSTSSIPVRGHQQDYNLIELFILIILFYLGGKLIARKLKKSIGQERKFWNTLLLFSFIGSAGTGMILVLIRDLEWFKNINFNFLFWHVEFSIIMALLGIFHALWHTKYYLSILVSKKKKVGTSSTQ